MHKYDKFLFMGHLHLGRFHIQKKSYKGVFE